MKPQTFTIEYKEEVPLETLKKIWEEIRGDLKKKGYQVENVQMPRVRAFVLSRKYFLEINKELLESPHIKDLGEAEYGEKSNANCSASIFYSDVNQEWIILKCEGTLPLEVDLNHELRHLCEDFLGLKWGSLTAKESNFKIR